MSSNPPDVFVLWGENFDEQMATAFIAQFREAGLRVKIVGLRGKNITGKHGVTLIPDMTLSQALPLAKLVRCVVLPCHSLYLTQINNDPRVQEFFQEASENDAQFVTGQVRLSDLEGFMNPVNVVSYFAETGVNEPVNQIKEKLFMSICASVPDIPLTL